MKLYIALSTLIALAQGCVTLTIKDDFKANTYSWAIWKDGKREVSRTFGGQRPPSVDADDGTNYWSVNVYPYDDFSKMSGPVTKYTSGKLAWNPTVKVQNFQDFGNVRRMCAHGGVNCAGKPCNLPA
ncbi:hypothetical protein FAVG1_09557 [Fusarium avenaceum]|nr:hypothetical protein FAVG1_09557 [Fusarium avenaceum]